MPYSLGGSFFGKKPLLNDPCWGPVIRRYNVLVEFPPPVLRVTIHEHVRMGYGNAVVHGLRGVIHTNEDFVENRLEDQR